jgi:LysM repeat protein
MTADSDVTDSEMPRTQPRWSGFRPWLERGLFVAALALLGAWHFGAFGPGRQTCVVVVDGKPVVVMASRAAADRLLEEIRHQAGADDVKTAQFAQRVDLYSVDPDRNPPVSDVQAMKILAPKLDVVVPGAGLFVNGKLFAGLSSRDAAVETFTLLLRELSPPDPDLTRAFKERVSIREGLLPIENYVPDAQTVLNQVREAMAAKITYTAKAGDSPWKIANDHGITIAQVKRANPGVDFMRLQVGQELVVPTGKAPVTVVAWKEVLEPVSGSDQMQTVRIVYENGVEVQRYVAQRPRRSPPEQSRPRRTSRRVAPPRETRTETPAAVEAPKPSAPPAEEPASQP